MNANTTSASDASAQDRLAFLVEATDGRRFKMVIKGDLHKLQVEKIRRYLKNNGVPDGQDIVYNGIVLRDDMIGEDFGLVPNAVLKLVTAGGSGATPRGITNINRSGSQQSAHSQVNTNGAGYRATLSNTSRAAEGSSPIPQRGSSPQSHSAQDIEARLRQLQRQHNDFTSGYSGGHSPSGGQRPTGAAAASSPAAALGTSSASYFDPLQQERQLRMQRMTGMSGLSSHAVPSEAPSGIQYSSANVSLGSHQFPGSIGGSPAKAPFGTQSNIKTDIQGLQQQLGTVVASRFGGNSTQPIKDPMVVKLENENEQLRRQLEQMQVDLARKRSEHPPSDDMMINAKANLLELSKDLGIHLTFDQNHTCVIGNDERNTILITFDAATERLYLYSTILTSLPRSETAKLKLYEALLDGALLGRDMAGGGVGISTQNNIMMLGTSFSLRNSSQYTLRDITPAFLDSLQRWRSVAADIIGDNL